MLSHRLVKLRAILNKWTCDQNTARWSRMEKNRSINRMFSPESRSGVRFLY